MEILKNRKKICPFLAVVLCVAMLILSVLAFLPLKSLDNKASASLSQEGYQNVRLSIDVVYNDNSQVNISYNTDSDTFQQFNVTNGFSLSDVLLYHNILVDVYNYRVSDIYVALFFDERPFDSSLYDFYFSEQRGIYSGLSHGFEYQTNQVLDIDFEEYLPPLSTFKAYRAVLPTDSNFSSGRLVSSFVFQLKLDFFQEMYRPYSLGYLDYCMFIYDKNSFVDYNTAYQQGYSGGYDYGYSTGHADGYAAGDNVGYNRGLNEGLLQSNTFTGLLSAVFDVPVKTFFGLFNFDLLGVNMAGFIQSLLTLAVVVTIVKIFV